MTLSVTGNILPLITRIITNNTMLKIKIKKKKKRIPIPQKPPKVEDGKKVYRRNKEKVKVRKSISE